MVFNWVDWVIIAVLIFNAASGWSAGLLYLGSSLIAFTTSLWLAVRFHEPVANFFGEKFGIAPSWAFVLGYVVVALFSEMILARFAEFIIKRLPKNIAQSKFNNGLGAVVSIINGLTIVTFFLILIVVLPLRGTVKQDVRASYIGSRILSFIENYGGPIKAATEQAQQEARKFFTILPKSKERVNLDFTLSDSQLRNDAAAESQMLEMINVERSKVGAPALIVDTKILPAARAHSRDMFLRHYFAHVTPEGKDVGDRLDEAGVVYFVAGENLAYAPDTKTAHDGLMDSPEHKKNILDPQFHRIGIGVVTSDSFGSMYTQNFAN